MDAPGTAAGGAKTKRKAKAKKPAAGKGPKGGKRKARRSKAGAARDAVAPARTCPTCYCPVTVSILRGMDDEGDDIDTSAMPRTKKARAAPSSVAAAAPSAPGVPIGRAAALCVVCMESQRDACILPCGHMYTCFACLSQMEKKLCPVCRGSISKVVRLGAGDEGESAAAAAAAAAAATSLAAPSAAAAASASPPATFNVRSGFGRATIMQRVKAEQFESSAKVDAVIHDIEAMIAADATSKAIVFSQYTSMIDIVEWKLSQLKVAHVKLMGYMSLAQRHAALSAFKVRARVFSFAETFRSLRIVLLIFLSSHPFIGITSVYYLAVQTRPEVKVVLMSIKAGGEGLNLQEASHVFVLEPWWNPQVEHQAIQRAHRIGQRRAVTAVRYIVKDSIEERMLELQNKKQLVFDGAVDGSAASLSSLTVDDLRFLFH